MQRSKIERGLLAFDWLTLDKWDREHLFNIPGVAGKNCCKICDAWVPIGEQAEHIEWHKRQRDDLRDKIKEENAAKREEEKEAAAEEKRLEKEAKTASEPAKVSKPAKRTRNTSKRQPKSDKQEVILTIQNALKNSGEGTIISLSKSTGLDANLIRNTIKSVDGVIVVGHVKSGGRGRPAIIYGIK